LQFDRHELVMCLVGDVPSTLSCTL